MAAAAMTPSWRRPIPRKHGGERVQRWIFGAWTALVFAFLYIPILLLIIFSFNSSRLNIRWEGFSLKWYAELLGNRTLLTAFQNSLIVASRDNDSRDAARHHRGMDALPLSISLSAHHWFSDLHTDGHARGADGGKPPR